jgi:hypothetical protein
MCVQPPELGVAVSNPAWVTTRDEECAKAGLLSLVTA